VTSITINKSPKLKKWLTRHVGYYANELFLLKREQFISAPEAQSQPKIIIVAKCHYSEAWQTFPSVNRKELDKILALKEQNISRTTAKFQIFKNDKIDGFEVKTISIDEEIVDSLGEDKLFIPETDVLGISNKDLLLEIETPAGKLFCANGNDVVKSSYAKGIVSSVDTFRLTAGLSNEIKSKQIEQDLYAQFIMEAFFNASVADLKATAIYNVKKWFNWPQLHLLYWAPLATALCFYLVTSGYYYYKTNTIAKTLEQGGNQVSEILKKKRTLDSNSAEIKALSQDFGEQSFVHYHWQIIYKLLNEKMTITRVTYDAPSITIRGTADRASDVLAAIAKYDNVKSAAFQGSVSKSRGKDSFVLTIEVSDN